MLKFNLKRRISGRAIKKAIRESKKDPHPPNRRGYWRNKPEGKKYPKAIYEITDKDPWLALKYIQKYKKERKKTKLKKLYDLFPEYSPAYIEHKE